MLDLRGRKLAVIERGRGDPLVYLHGFADVHGVAADLQPFHARLAEVARVIAPAHPGCAGSDELGDGYGIDDVVFHYLELFDALGLERFDLVGHCVGGWIAAELAVRHPQRVRRLLFADADAPAGLRFFPDGRGDLEEELRRYQMLRFGSFVGFKPPYFYNRALTARLYRAAMPALVLWGEHDRMIARAHGEAYVAGLPG